MALPFGVMSTNSKNAGAGATSAALLKDVRARLLGGSVPNKQAPRYLHQQQVLVVCSGAVSAGLSSTALSRKKSMALICFCARSKGRVCGVENAFVACGMVFAWEVGDGGMFRARVSSIEAAQCPLCPFVKLGSNFYRYFRRRNDTVGPVTLLGS